ncbi:MAG: calcium/proton exchanger, partial [Acidimicrobiales bacterium]
PLGGPARPAGGAGGRLGLAAGDWRLVAGAALLTIGSGVTHYLAVPSVLAFAVSAVGLAFLAALVGRSVDALGDRLGTGATGAIQSALGNLPELFFSIFALRAGLIGVVQAALIGSILGNVLLVLGLAFVAGGVRHGPQRFRADQARLLSLLLLLAVAVVIVPTLASALDIPAAHHEGALSDVAAVILLAVYAAGLLGALGPPGRHGGAVEPAHMEPAPQEPTSRGSAHLEPAGAARWPLPVALIVLAAASAAAAAVSNWFVDALRPAIHALGISEAFAGLVIVAIAGNAVENFVGVQMARRNQTDLALSVILQSPLQIALVLIPVLVLISPVIGGAALTLVFPPLLLASAGLAVVVAAFVVVDGESTWMEGVALLGLYAVIAAAFWWG